MEERLKKINVETLENTTKISNLIIKNIVLAKEAERILIFEVFDNFFSSWDFMSKQEFEKIKQIINNWLYKK